MLSRAQIRWTGILAMIGGAIWAASWTLNAFTQDGTRAVLGLSERGWRRLLDPALLFLIAGLTAHQLRSARRLRTLGKIGFVTSLVGLVAMLVGNVIEFWIGELLYVDVPGKFKPTDHVGWVMFLIGFMILSIGLILLGIAHLNAKLLFGWRRILPLSIGLVLVVLAVVAGPLVEARSANLLLAAMIYAFALGWIALGYDLWSSTLEEPNANAVKPQI